MPPRVSKKSSQTTTNIDFLQALNKYIPSLVLQQLVSRSEKAPGATQRLPELQPMETAVLFADISGFTNLGEACAKQGVRGNEELAFCINRYMEGMVKNFGKYGGDIIKFVGDALIVMWPSEKGANKESNTVRKAIQCAIDIQKEMNNFTVITGVSALSVKIGLGYGNCALLYVGGVFNRAEFFTVGPALTYALKSEGEATSGGQIIVSETAFKYVRQLYQAREIISEKNEKFYHIEKLIGEGVKTRADALQIRSNISNETYNKISVQLRGCVPAAIIPYLQIGAEEFGSETRSLTVMFASLGVELSSAETQEGMEKIQKIVVCVQEQVYRHQGSVNKLVMDDKGSTLICLWGLSPMCHDDDAARAILTAFNIRKELKKLDGTYCNIGISSGEMFSGVVGTSGGRKEFSVLGDVANLAARIMYWPKKFGQKGKIHVDLNTRTLASNYFNFIYGGHQEFKGKSISIPIFEPIEIFEEFADITKKSISPSVFLKLHMNPLCLERGTNASKAQIKMIGPAQDTVLDLAQEIIEYFSSKQQRPYLAAIKGEIGSGKTMFARALYDELLSDEDFSAQMNQKSIFCSSINAETQYQFLNIWRPILAQMLTFYCKRENLKREQVFQQILSFEDGLQQNQKFIRILCDIFDVNFETVIKITGSNPEIQLKPLNRSFPFVQRENYSDRYKVLKILLEFVKLLLGEILNQNLIQKQDFDQQPILVILDNSHLIDSPSWEFFELIRDECHRIGLILLQQCDEMGELIIAPESKQVFDLVWHAKNMDSIHQIELPVLNLQTLRNLLKSLAPKYQMTYMDEIMKMIEIVNPKDTIKTEEQGKQWKERFSTLWQVKDQFTDVSDEVISVILRRCAGNPLLSLNYFVSLTQNGFIQMNSKSKMVATQKFTECIQLNNFLSVPSPRIAIKKNCALIDKYLQNIYQKTQKRPGELEMCVKSIVLMKAASILGDEFDTKSLQSIIPLRYPETIQSLKNMLKLLEAAYFIEIVDETDKDNLICRFNKPFLRESIYQIVLYRDQKQSIHGAAATYLLHNQVEVISGSKVLEPQIQHKILANHMLIAQDCKEEKELSFQARTGLIVKQIQAVLDADPNSLIKKEDIFKQGQAANKKTSKRLVTIDATSFRWYHNDKELQDGTYLGSVPIQFIFQTVSSKMAWMARPSFSISTTSWFDKHGIDQGRRDFFFACNDDLQMESWIITIEFLRTKAVYDAYAQKNIPVPFPIKNDQGSQKLEERKDYSNLLFDFTSQFKQNSQIRVSNLNQSGLGLKNQGNHKEHKNQNLNNTSMQQQNTSDLVLKIKQLYGIGFISFQHHLQQTSAKVTVKQQAQKLGKLSDKLGQVLTEKLDTLLQKDEASMYGSQRSEKISVTVTNNFLKDENQLFIERGVIQRRGSSISADHILTVLEQAQNQYIKNDLIHEESEGQTSSEQDQQKFVTKYTKPHHRKTDQRRSEIVQNDQLQKLHHDTVVKYQPSNESEFARLTKNSESSQRPTPPFSITQPSQILHNQTGTTVLNLEQDENRQTFKPDEDVLALFNQDERLDHLRSQSPPQQQNLNSAQIYREQNNNITTEGSKTQQPKLIDQKNTLIFQNSAPRKSNTLENQFLSQSTISRQDDLIQQQIPTQQILLSLQQLIQQSLDSGVSKLLQQNESIFSKQKEELNIMFKQHNQQLLAQQSSLSLSQGVYDSPSGKQLNVGKIQALNSANKMINLLNYDSRPNRISVTSSRKNVKGYEEMLVQLPPKQIRDEEPIEPLSPPNKLLHSDVKFDQQHRVQNKKYQQESRNELDRLSQIMAQQPIYNRTKQKSEDRISDQSVRTIKRSEDFVPEAYQTSKSSLGFNNDMAKNDFKTSLINFSREQIVYNNYTNQNRQISNSQNQYSILDLQQSQIIRNQIPVKAICVRDSFCQQNRSFKVYQGSQVEILESIPSHKLYRIEFKNQEGLFLMNDFSKIVSTVDRMSRAVEKQSKSGYLPQQKNINQQFSAESDDMRYKNESSRVTNQEYREKIQQRVLDDDNNEVKQNNLKMLDRLQKKKRQKSHI